MQPWAKVTVGLMAALAGVYLGVVSESANKVPPAKIPNVLNLPKLKVRQVSTAGPNVGTGN